MSHDFEKERRRQPTHSMVSDNSFLRDSYTTSGTNGEGPSTYDPTAKETLMPSPARTPMYHSNMSHYDFGNPPSTARTLSPPPTAPSAQFGTLGRTHHDGSRGSKFTEDV